MDNKIVIEESDDEEPQTINFEYYSPTKHRECIQKSRKTKTDVPIIQISSTDNDDMMLDSQYPDSPESDISRISDDIEIISLSDSYSENDFDMTDAYLETRKLKNNSGDKIGHNVFTDSQQSILKKSGQSHKIQNTKRKDVSCHGSKGLSKAPIIKSRQEMTQNSNFQNKNFNQTFLGSNNSAVLKLIYNAKSSANSTAKNLSTKKKYKTVKSLKSKDDRSCNKKQNKINHLVKKTRPNLLKQKKVSIKYDHNTIKIVTSTDSSSAGEIEDVRSGSDSDVPMSGSHKVVQQNKTKTLDDSAKNQLDTCEKRPVISSYSRRLSLDKSRRNSQVDLTYSQTYVGSENLFGPTTINSNKGCRSSSPDMFSDTETLNQIETKNAKQSIPFISDNISESNDESDDNDPLINLLHRPPRQSPVASDDDTQDPNFTEEDIFTKFKMQTDSLVHPLDEPMTKIQETDDESTQEPEIDFQHVTSKSSSSIHSDTSDELPNCAFLTQPFTVRPQSSLLPDEQSDMTKPVKNINLNEVSQKEKNTKQSQGDCSSKLKTLCSENKNIDASWITTQLEPSPIFGKSKFFHGTKSKQQVKDPFHKLSSTPQKRHNMINSCSSSNIFEKMAASSQTLLKNSQVDDTDEVEIDEIVKVPVLKFGSSVHKVLGPPGNTSAKYENHIDNGNSDNVTFDGSELMHDDTPFQIKKSKVDIGDIHDKDEKQLCTTNNPNSDHMSFGNFEAKHDDTHSYSKKSKVEFGSVTIKEEPDDTLNYTQDEDDIVEIFDSDDEDALLCLSQVPVRLKAEPLSDSEEEDEFVAMQRLYLSQLEVPEEPRSKIAKLGSTPEHSLEQMQSNLKPLKASDQMECDVDLFDTDYFTEDNEPNLTDEMPATLKGKHKDAKHISNYKTPDKIFYKPDGFSDDDLSNDTVSLENLCSQSISTGKKNEISDEKFYNTETRRESSVPNLYDTAIHVNNLPKRDSEIKENISVPGIEIDISTTGDEEDDQSPKYISDCELYHETTIIDDYNNEIHLTKSVAKTQKQISDSEITICKVDAAIDVDKLSSDEFYNDITILDKTPSNDQLDGICIKDGVSNTAIKSPLCIVHSTEPVPSTSRSSNVSNEDFYNLLSEADGIQSPGHVTNYKTECNTASLKTNTCAKGDEVFPDLFYIHGCSDTEASLVEATKEDTSPQEEPMDESDNEMYYANTQLIHQSLSKKLSSSDENLSDYNICTQVDNTSVTYKDRQLDVDKLSTSLKTKTRQIIQIDPKRQESSKELRDKYKKPKESSVSKNLALSKGASPSKYKSVSESKQKKALSISSLKNPNLSKTFDLKKHPNKSNNQWLTASNNTKAKPAKKTVKQKRSRNKSGEEEPFSFTQKIGMAKKQLKKRKLEPDAPKIPTAKLTKTRCEEEYLHNSDVQLPDVTDIINKQLPILSCDVNQITKSNVQFKTNHDPLPMNTRMYAKQGSEQTIKTSESTFVSTTGKQTSKDPLYIAKSGSKNVDNINYRESSKKKSLCVEKVKKNRNSSAMGGETVKQNIAVKQKLVTVKDIKVVQKTSKPAKDSLLLDDLINKLGPVDKPTYLPFQMKTKTPVSSVRHVSTEPKHANPELNSSKEALPIISHVPRLPDSHVFPTKLPSNITVSNQNTAIDKVTSILNTCENINVRDPRKAMLDPRLKKNVPVKSINDVLAKLTHLKPLSDSNNQVRSMIPSTTKSSEPVKLSNENPRRDHNLMLKPVPCQSNINKENKTSTTERIFDKDDYFKLVLNWNPIWLSEQDKQKANSNLPPILGKRKVYPLLESYCNLQDYQEILLSLMVLETWEMVFRDWKEKHRSKKAVIFNIGLERIEPEGEFIRLVWQNIIPDEVYRDNYPREGDLVKIDIWGASLDTCRPKDGQSPQGMHYSQIAYVEKVVVTKKQELESLVGRVRALAQDPLCKGKTVTSMKIITRLKYKRISPIGNKLMKLESLSSLVSNLRQVAALAYLPRSPLQQYIIKPGNERVFCHQITNSKDLLNQFDQSQSEAICTLSQAVQQPQHIPKICLLQGPPGTGKSHTIVGLLNTVIKESNGGCICVATPSNAAADELMRRLIKDKRKKNGKSCALKFVRIGNVDNIHLDIKAYCWDVLYQTNREMKLKEKQKQHIPGSVRQDMKRMEDRISKLRHDREDFQNAGDKLKSDKCLIDLKKLKQQQRTLEKQYFSSINQGETLTPKEDFLLKIGILLHADVICGTLSSFGNPRILDILKNDPNNSSGKRRIHFNCLIIDEASQASEIDCLIPLQYGMSKLILVGDPEQLPATVLSKEAGDMNYGQSLLERLYNYFQHNNPSAISMLKTQYRMDRTIFSFPNRLIYNGQLETHKSVDDSSRHFPLEPYLVFDMICGIEMANAGAICNIIEARCTVELCQLISIKSKISPAGIGVICPYQSQKALVTEGLRQRDLGKVEVGTVDGFQGREKLVIILTCVRAQSTTGGIGFLADRRRMNVAMTRAKNALYILGHLKSLQRSGDWSLLIEDAYERKKVLRVTEESQFSKIAEKCFKKLHKNIL